MRSSRREYRKRISSIVVLAAVLVAGCRGPDAPKADPLKAFEGNVLVLLMGKPGCPGTEKGTAFLRDYHRTKPDGVALARIDVPPPGGVIRKPADWHGLHAYAIDGDRALAERLDFFFYPTLYLFDRDGEMRYAGAFDPEALPELAEFLADEAPGAEKEMLSPVLPARGAVAEAFEGETDRGDHVTLGKLLGDKGTLLLFGSTTCPFSKAAVESVPGLTRSFASRGVNTVIVNVGVSEASLSTFYGSRAPGVPVIKDEDAYIGKELYGIQGVPFCFILDHEGKVTDRMPFDADSARNALSALFGEAPKPGKPKRKARGAG